MTEYPKVFGRDQLMAYSGMEGPTSAWGGIVASAIGERLGYWLHTNRERWNADGVRVYLAAENLSGPEDAVFDVVLGDLCRGRVQRGESESQFAFLPLTMRGFGIEVKTLNPGMSKPAPLHVEIEISYESFQVDVQGERAVVRYKDEAFTIVFPGGTFVRKADNLIAAEIESSGRIAIAWGDEERPTTDVEMEGLFGIDWEDLAQKRLEWINGLAVPPNLSERYRAFYLRCCSSLKTNSSQPEGAMTVPWTTPDRWPHRHCYFWDSAFQALGYALIDPEWGKNAVRAQWCQQRDDGFITSMVHHDGTGSAETNSAVLAWLTWEMMGPEPDREFVEDEAYPHLAAYHRCCLAHRDPKWHNLIVWDRFSHGMDNSGRFDAGLPKVFIDANLYVVHDLLIMEKMARFLENEDEAGAWRKAWKELGKAVNDHLWDEEDGFYYDMAEDGSLVKTKSMAAFVALLAEIVSGERKERLLARLLDPDEFWTKMPIATMSLTDPTYWKNMWRGPMWPNTSYVAYRALQKAGRTDEARELAERVLEEEVRWYEATGGIYEFYDAEGEVPPLELGRKTGKGALNDYGWGMAVGAKLCWETNSRSTK